MLRGCPSWIAAGAAIAIAAVMVGEVSAQPGGGGTGAAGGGTQSGGGGTGSGQTTPQTNFAAFASVSSADPAGTTQHVNVTLTWTDVKNGASSYMIKRVLNSTGVTVGTAATAAGTPATGAAQTTVDIFVPKGKFTVVDTTASAGNSYDYTLWTVTNGKLDAPNPPSSPNPIGTISPTPLKVLLPTSTTTVPLGRNILDTSIWTDLNSGSWVMDADGTFLQQDDNSSTPQTNKRLVRTIPVIDGSSSKFITITPAGTGTNPPPAVSGFVVQVTASVRLAGWDKLVSGAGAFKVDPKFSIGVGFVNPTSDWGGFFVLYSDRTNSQYFRMEKPNGDQIPTTFKQAFAAKDGTKFMMKLRMQTLDGKTTHFQAKFWDPSGVQPSSWTLEADGAPWPTAAPLTIQPALYGGVQGAGNGSVTVNFDDFMVEVFTGAPVSTAMAPISPSPYQAVMSALTPPDLDEPVQIPVAAITCTQLGPWGTLIGRVEPVPPVSVACTPPPCRLGVPLAASTKCCASGLSVIGAPYPGIGMPFYGAAADWMLPDSLAPPTPRHCRNRATSEPSSSFPEPTLPLEIDQSLDVSPPFFPGPSTAIPRTREATGELIQTSFVADEHPLADAAGESDLAKPSTAVTAPTRARAPNQALALPLTSATLRSLRDYGAIPTLPDQPKPPVGVLSQSDRLMADSLIRANLYRECSAVVSFLERYQGPLQGKLLAETKHLLDLISGSNDIKRILTELHKSPYYEIILKRSLTNLYIDGTSSADIQNVVGRLGELGLTNIAMRVDTDRQLADSLIRRLLIQACSTSLGALERLGSGLHATLSGEISSLDEAKKKDRLDDFVALLTKSPISILDALARQTADLWVNKALPGELKEYGRATDDLERFISARLRSLGLLDSAKLHDAHTRLVDLLIRGLLEKAFADAQNSGVRVPGMLVEGALLTGAIRSAQSAYQALERLWESAGSKNIDAQSLINLVNQLSAQELKPLLSERLANALSERLAEINLDARLAVELITQCSNALKSVEKLGAASAEPILREARSLLERSRQQTDLAAAVSLFSQSTPPILDALARQLVDGLLEDRVNYKVSTLSAQGLKPWIESRFALLGLLDDAKLSSAQNTLTDVILRAVIESACANYTSSLKEQGDLAAVAKLPDANRLLGKVAASKSASGALAELRSSSLSNAIDPQTLMQRIQVIGASDDRSLSTELQLLLSDRLSQLETNIEANSRVKQSLKTGVVIGAKAVGLLVRPKLVAATELLRADIFPLESPAESNLAMAARTSRLLTPRPRLRPSHARLFRFSSPPLSVIPPTTGGPSQPQPAGPSPPVDTYGMAPYDKSYDNQNKRRYDPFSSQPVVSVILLPASSALDSSSSASSAADDGLPPDDRLRATRSSLLWTYHFDHPARFPAVKFGPKCCAAFEGEGAVIHEGMRLLVRQDGQYEVRFNITTQPVPLMLRLQLILFEQGQPQLPVVQSIPRTITLPPISVRRPASDQSAFPNSPAGSVEPDSFLVSVRGYSQVLKETHESGARPGHLLLVKRIGTARIGSGVQYQVSQ